MLSFSYEPTSTTSLTELNTFHNCASNPCLCGIPLNEPAPCSGANPSAQSQYTFGATPEPNMNMGMVQQNRLVVAPVSRQDYQKLTTHTQKSHATNCGGAPDMYGLPTPMDSLCGPSSNCFDPKTGNTTLCQSNGSCVPESGSNGRQLICSLPLPSSPDLANYDQPATKCGVGGKANHQVCMAPNARCNSDLLDTGTSLCPLDASCEKLDQEAGFRCQGNSPGYGLGNVYGNSYHNVHNLHNVQSVPKKLTVTDCGVKNEKDMYGLPTPMNSLCNNYAQCFDPKTGNITPCQSNGVCVPESGSNGRQLICSLPLPSSPNLANYDQSATQCGIDGKANHQVCMAPNARCNSDLLDTGTSLCPLDASCEKLDQEAGFRCQGNSPGYGQNYPSLQSGTVVNMY